MAAYQSNTPPDDSTLQPLAEDNDRPAAPSDYTGRRLPPDHPATDSNLDAHEMYDEGVTGATDVDAQDETDTDKDEALSAS